MYFLHQTSYSLFKGIKRDNEKKEAIGNLNRFITMDMMKKDDAIRAANDKAREVQMKEVKIEHIKDEKSYLQIKNEQIQLSNERTSFMNNASTARIPKSPEPFRHRDISEPRPPISFGNESTSLRSDHPKERPPRKEKPIPPKEKPVPPKEIPIPPNEKPLPPKEKPLPPKDKPLPLREEPIPQKEMSTPPKENPIKVKTTPQKEAIPSPIEMLSSQRKSESPKININGRTMKEEVLRNNEGANMDQILMQIKCLNDEEKRNIFLHLFNEMSFSSKSTLMAEILAQLKPQNQNSTQVRL